MLETWIQWTCDGCEETETYPSPNATKQTVRAYLRQCGWRSFGSLDYCHRCVAKGIHRKRESVIG